MSFRTQRYVIRASLVFPLIRAVYLLPLRLCYFLLRDDILMFCCLLVLIFNWYALVAVGLLDWYGQPRIDAKKLNMPASDAINFRDILGFPLSSWLIFAVTVFFYITVNTFYTG